MEIIINNDQNKVEINDDINLTIKNVVAKVIHEEDTKKDYEVCVTIVDNESIKEINKESRNIYEVTDVLSFPMIDRIDGSFSEFDINKENNCFILGDIIISAERALEQANEFGHTFKREIAFLVTHGMLHLFGYDHIESQMESIMLKKQNNILESLKISR